MYKENQIAKVIRYIGWIEIVGGVIGSIILGTIKWNVSIYKSFDFNWFIILPGVIISIVTGVLIIGFAEIISLLQQKVNQTEKITRILSIIEETKVQSDNNELPQL